MSCSTETEKITISNSVQKARALEVFFFWTTGQNRCKQLPFSARELVHLRLSMLTCICIQAAYLAVSHYCKSSVAPIKVEKDQIILIAELTPETLRRDCEQEAQYDIYQYERHFKQRTVTIWSSSLTDIWANVFILYRLRIMGKALALLPALPGSYRACH